MDGLELFESISKYNIGKFSILYEKNTIDSNGKFIGNPNVIFHEYFHLVQSLSTIFGLWIFVNEIEIIFEHSNYFKNSCYEDKLYDPLKVLNQIRYSNHIKNVDTAAYKCPKVKFSKRTVFEGFFSSTQKVLLKKNKPYPIVTAIFKDCERRFKYDISARSICEAYSKAVEYELSVDYNYITRFSKLTDKICEQGQFEYYAIRLILIAKFPNISEKCVAVILHWSLNHVSPGVMFKDIVEFLEKKHGQNLPCSSDLSKEIFDNIFAKYSDMYKDLLKILEAFVMQKILLKEDSLAKVLSDILSFYKNSLAYLDSNAKIIPCLELYPFKKSGVDNPSITMLMENNAKIIPLPLYQRIEDGRYFSISQSLRSNFLFLDALFYVVERLNHGGINDRCPYEKFCYNCILSDFGLRKENNGICTMHAAMRYFY